MAAHRPLDVFAGSVACALMIAVLWGGNIGTVYPIVEVAFRGESLPSMGRSWCGFATSSASSTTRTPNLFDARAMPARRLAACSIAPVSKGNLHLSAASWPATAGCRTRSSSPTCPTWTPFKPLALTVGLLLAGTAVKSLFMVANSVLVSRLSQLATLRLRNIFYRRTLDMEVARFSNDGTSDLMNRFTGDMEALASGFETKCSASWCAAAENDRLPGQGQPGSVACGCCSFHCSWHLWPRT